MSLVKIPEQYIGDRDQGMRRGAGLITGQAPRYFRPPGGEYDPRVAETAEALGYTMVLWTDDPGDYASPGVNAIRVRTLRNVRGGGIILLHDGIPETVDALPNIIETLKRSGFRFVTVDELARHARPTRPLPAPQAAPLPAPRAAPKQQFT